MICNKEVYHNIGKYQLTTSNYLYREGTTVIFTVINLNFTNGATTVTIPEGYRPQQAVYNTVLLTRGGSPTHVIGYMCVTEGGVITVVEPYNGSYRLPTASVFGEVVWSLL